MLSLKRITFSIDRFKTSHSNFEFYTAFQNYAKFKVEMAMEIKFILFERRV